MGNVIISREPRQSNFELLRIVAMFLILVLHSDFWTLGAPTWDDFIITPFAATTRTTFQAVSIVSVNIFILISGWFGIRSNLKSLLNFLFQCMYFLFGIYAVLLLIGKVQITPSAILDCFLLTAANWFIKAYLGLYLLSPVLNAFVDKVSKPSFQKVLISFFIFQTYFGITNAAQFIDFGYSTFSFVGLYLLARYLRIYGLPIINSNASWWGGVIYCVSACCNIIVYIILKKLNISVQVFTYINPLVIVGAVGMVIMFSGLTIRTSRIINWISTSSFAVFLLHANPNIGVPMFQPLIKRLYQQYDGIICLISIAVTLILIFLISIVLDQPRKFLWGIVSRHFK